MESNVRGIVLALLAAILYAINIPASKVLLRQVDPTFMAAFLYLGAGVGVGILALFLKSERAEEKRLTKGDLPYVIGMIVLDIAAPIFMMFGLKYGTSSNASLLGNFEIVATTLIALLLFREKVSKRLWGAIALITVSSAILSFEGVGSFRFSLGSLLVIAATLCWGLENNCTRSISDKSTYQIVILKGLFSGLGALIIAFLLRESFPTAGSIAIVMALGFVAYGLSIFLYVRAQSVLGAAKTSAYYAVNPFLGAFLSFVFLREHLTAMYLVALVIMLAGAVLVVRDTLIRNHSHLHAHTFTHTHDGSTHSHTIEHSHDHTHVLTEGAHEHHHPVEELERELHDHQHRQPDGYPGLLFGLVLQSNRGGRSPGPEPLQPQCGHPLPAGPGGGRCPGVLHEKPGTDAVSSP